MDTLVNLGADELFNERVRFFTEFLDDDVSFQLQLNLSMVKISIKQKSHNSCKPENDD